MKLQYKILLGIIPLMIISIFSIGLWSLHEAKRYIHDFTYSYMEVLLDSYFKDHILSRQGMPEKPGLTALYKKEAIDALRAVPRSPYLDLMIIDSTGKIIYNLSNHDNRYTKTEINELLKGINTEPDKEKKGHLKTGRHSEIYVARYFRPWDWILYFSIHDEYFKGVQRHIRYAILGVSAVCVLLTVVVIFILSRLFLINPIRKLKSAALMISQRRAVETVDVRSGDELGELARSMESMSASIQRYHARLLNCQAGLEEKVRRRTRELHEANRILKEEINERRKAEEELKKSERKLKEAQQVAHLGYWEYDPVSNKLYWSEEIYRIFGVDPGEFGGSYEDFMGMVHPEDRESVDRAYRESVKNRTTYDLVHRLLLKDGTVKYVHERCRTEYDENGKPLHSIGTVLDITELKLAEEELQEYRDCLEEKVKKRTAEISAKNAELERLNRLFADREFRIKELRDKVKELTREIERLRN
ncbi:MAG: PAS domain-containing protein [Deferribacteres bacterium]|nr:PAS domain-containing protein [Deferribacteres bacterium]